jgi:hypothetical protein
VLPFFLLAGLLLVPMIEYGPDVEDEPYIESGNFHIG